MRNLRRIKFILELSLPLLFWPTVYADDIQWAANERTSASSNHLHKVPDTELASSKVAAPRSDVSTEKHEEHHFVDESSPTENQNVLPQEAASLVPRHEYQRGTASRHQSAPIHFQQPVINSRRRQSEIYYQKKKFTPEMNYVMKAGGKENFYAEDSSNEYQSPGAEFSSSPENKDRSMEYKTNKKMNYEKSYKNNYKYSYSTRGETGLHAPDRELYADAGRYSEVRTGALNAPPDQINYPKYSLPAPRTLADKRATMDFYAAKSSSWKQLGPNVEISTSAEHPVHPKRDSPPEAPKNANKKRKTLPKNVRTGYLNQQHALYIANNLANIANLQTRPVKGIFDHNNVLKQSDKFELSDAMFQELEEAAKKNNDAQVRIKQESPKEQIYKIQPEISNGFPHYYQSNGPLVSALPIESNPYVGKYYQPHPLGTLSKGFIRNIEVETSPSGGKRMIPALIIPLTPDQLNNHLFNQEIGLYVNNPEVLNPGAKVRQSHPFPYEMINSRYSQHEPYNTFVTTENYQYHQQIPSNYELRVAEDYSPYVNYQTQNLYRLPYNLNSGPSTVASVDVKSPETRAAPYSTKKKFNHKAVHHPQPIQANHLSQVHPSESSKVQLNYPNREEYVFDGNKDEHYLSASESFTTIASAKDKDQKMVEKIETKAK